MFYSRKYFLLGKDQMSIEILSSLGVLYRTDENGNYVLNRRSLETSDMFAGMDSDELDEELEHRLNATFSKGIDGVVIYCMVWANYIERELEKIILKPDEREITYRDIIEATVHFTFDYAQGPHFFTLIEKDEKFNMIAINMVLFGS
jgi:hypothetical protein